MYLEIYIKKESREGINKLYAFNKGSTSPPDGNQVDGLPSAASLITRRALLLKSNTGCREGLVGIGGNKRQMYKWCEALSFIIVSEGPEG